MSWKTQLFNGPLSWKSWKTLIQKFRAEAYLFQDSLIEKLLQFLVAVVNAELLKAVHLEIFYNTMTNNNPLYDTLYIQDKSGEPVSKIIH